MHNDCHAEQEAERAAAKERKDREEREREAHRKLARETEEAQKRRARAAAADAAANYRTLLSETVKDSDASWNEWRVRLAKDPQVCSEILWDSLPVETSSRILATTTCCSARI